MTHTEGGGQQAQIAGCDADAGTDPRLHRYLVPTDALRLHRYLALEWKKKRLPNISGRHYCKKGKAGSSHLGEIPQHVISPSISLKS